MSNWMQTKLGHLKSTIKNSRYYAIAHRLREEYRWQRKPPFHTPFGFKVIGDDGLQRGRFEEEEIKLILRHLPMVDLFVDIGANVGFYTCLARSQGIPSIAFEPEMHNLRTLYRNLALNGFQDTEVWPIGLADGAGLRKIYGAHTGASLVKGWAGISSDNWAQTIPVNTLDNVLGRRFEGKQLFIKLDVEGAEFSVLKGAQRTLHGSPKKPIWLVEITQCLHRPEANPNFIATFELFWQNGYEVRTADSQFRLVTPAQVHRWAQNGLPDAKMYDWYFSPTA